VNDQPLVGTQVLLDTTVYIDVLKGSSPPELDQFIKRRICNHSSVCLAALTHAFGRLDPAHPSTRSTLAEIEKTISDIPDHRLGVPGVTIWGNAGILAGLLFRLGGYSTGMEKKCLNDAILFLHGRSLGMPVLTRNIKDFDFLNQLLPDGKIILYERI